MSVAPWGVALFDGSIWRDSGTARNDYALLAAGNRRL